MLEVTEEWRAIGGYEGRYEVSNLGRVRSIDRWVKNGPESIRWVTGRVLRPSADGHAGYYTVKFPTDDGRPTSKRIHQMVLEAFVGPRPSSKHGACHVDDRDKSNNALTNLEWKTQKGNMEDRERHGTTARGERVGRARLTEALVISIRQDPRSDAKLARLYQVGKSTIGSARRRETWKHV